MRRALAVLIFSELFSVPLAFQKAAVSTVRLPLAALAFRRPTTHWPLSAGPTASEGKPNLHLTPRLDELVQRLRGLPDDTYRYKQILFMATQLAPLAAAKKVPANKVPGCVSSAYVHAYQDDKGGVVLEGDSDAQIAKGLLALLIEGVSGCNPDEIDAVDPGFIPYCGLGASLTPGRSNGFLNMLAVIKKKAMELHGTKG